ncbi:iron dicitrate transport regulator FecR [Tumebacillus sp. ITR2]|uniref:protein acetyllysine N-acetyltransferase n=1 Tax=Tumebacillus amylolyticus TaxID=2801339 RepID=A0ABS1JBQ0_9BACL|nr:iron dicitrate transport regulator FecR [Tumebacillus amylolyticus]
MDVSAEWKEWARAAQRPVAITGAGISVPSGLPTINREWRGVPLREVFTEEMFKDDPARFYQCYREMLLDWREARPNPAHEALAARGVRIITQNFDGLHQEAGSKEVLEIHGNLRELVCLHCREVYPAHVAETNHLPHCPTCGNLLKPNIVLLGEKVRHIVIATDWVGQCDLLLVIGTKLEMAPVRLLPEIADVRGVPIIRCNKGSELLLPELFA